MMRRRVVVALLSNAALTAPFAVIAQLKDKVARIGYLSPGANPMYEQFRLELRRLGYAEGRNIALEYRSAEGDFARLSALAAELARLPVDILVAQVTQASIAAKDATATIPVVMIGVSDPVASGLVASLARPGGNVTGTSAVVAGVAGKQLELVRELAPGAARVAALWNPANRVFQQQQLNEARAAAAELKLELRLIEARNAAEVQRAFDALAREPASVLLVLGDPVFVMQARQIAELARRLRLPTVSSARHLADAGVLLTYGPSFDDAVRSGAVYVDKILKGAKPADLPVERSARFELSINLATARALGLALPQSLLLRADRVIE